MSRFNLLTFMLSACSFLPNLGLANGELIPTSKISTCTQQVAHLMKPRARDESFESYTARRHQLEGFLPAYSKDAKAIFFQYDTPGLSFSVQHSAYRGSDSRGVDAQAFWLTYDPQHFNPLSIIRRTFGNQPLKLNLGDVDHFDQTMLLSQEGISFEIYLKRRGLIMISRDSGQVLFYPPGTDTDKIMSNTVTGTVSAIWDFAKGLAGEFQCAVCQYTGLWFTDRDIIEVRAEGDKDLPERKALK